MCWQSCEHQLSVVLGKKLLLSSRKVWEIQIFYSKFYKRNSSSMWLCKDVKILTKLYPGADCSYRDVIDFLQVVLYVTLGHPVQIRQRREKYTNREGIREKGKQGLCKESSISDCMGLQRRVGEDSPYSVEQVSFSAMRQPSSYSQKSQKLTLMVNTIVDHYVWQWASSYKKISRHCPTLVRMCLCMCVNQNGVRQDIWGNSPVLVG